jgi:hypothetical protein
MQSWADAEATKEETVRDHVCSFRNAESRMTRRSIACLLSVAISGTPKEGSDEMLRHPSLLSGEPLNRGGNRLDDCRPEDTVRVPDSQMKFT